MDTISPSDNYEKRQKAMQTRLGKLDKSNPVVAEAIKRNQPKKDAWEIMRPIEELVSAARCKLDDGSKYSQVMKDLSRAILGLASKSPLDKKNSKDQNIDIEDDY